MEVRIIKTCYGWREMVLLDGVPCPRELVMELTVAKIREAKRQLEKHRIEVRPNLWVEPGMIAPSGLIRIPKRVWDTMLEMAEKLSVPTTKPEEVSATSVTPSLERR